MKKIFAAVLALTLIAPAAAFANHMKFEDIDTNKDGFITKDEANAYHDKQFAKKDANSDTKISKEEFDAYHKEKKHFWNKDKDADNSNE